MDEIPEIVGSKDLRDVFEDKGEVKGSFFINNIEFHQFRANSIENVIAQINAKEAEAFVTAAIDDGYHLVLEAHSPAPILIRQGAAYVETPPAGGDTAAAIKAVIEAGRRDRHHDRNTVLEDLGLEATHREEGDRAPYSIPPGMTAEDRRKARHERAVARGAIRGTPPDREPKGSGSRLVPQVGSHDENRRYNPVTPADRMPRSTDRQQNNPDVQVAPSSNSDHQPTASDL